MKAIRRFFFSLAPLLLLVSVASVSEAQARRQKLRTPQPIDPAITFFTPYGLDNFSDHHIEALSALLRAQEQFDKKKYGLAKAILDELWADYPTGGLNWGALPTKPFGINIGSPPAYYGLRMLSDTTDWHVQNPGHGPALRTGRLTVILVGESNGIQPRNLIELNNGTGIFAQHTLDPLLLANGSSVVHESLHLFREYVVAMTEGKLGIETHILHLPDVDLPVEAKVVNGSNFAGLVDASQIWPFVSAQDIEETDWWWILYPSHVPDQYPAFVNTEFITGGMGLGPNASPFFIIDDQWLVRKPPHIGTGPYSKVERDVYLPQWLQHEFFHHLFRTYPEFGLEDTPHQWFNRSTWPPDFVGRYEPDYYHESLYKRLQDATTPMVAALRYATAGAPWSSLSINDVLGSYQRNPVQNLWHNGTIQFSPQLEWQNFAGVDWNLQDDLANGQLLTGPDCPYFGTPLGNQFSIELERDALGDFTTNLEGFSFNGELYERLGP